MGFYETTSTRVVELELSLYGHPASGNRWEGKMDESVAKCGFQKAPDWKAVYRHAKTGAALGVYVDDFELAADHEDEAKLWQELGKSADSSACWDQKPTYKDIEAIMAKSSLDTCPEVQPHRLQA